MRSTFVDEAILYLKVAVEDIERRQRALSSEARRRIAGGPFMKMPVAPDADAEVFLFTQKPKRAHLEVIIEYLRLAMDGLPEDEAALAAGAAQEKSE